VEGVDLVVLDEADGFTATADGNVDAVENHRTRGERNRLEARSALPVDGGSGHRRGKSGAQQRLARNVASRRALLHGATHHDVLDLCGIHLGARNRSRDGVTQQRRTFGIVQSALVGPADRGTGRRDDHSFGHLSCSLSV